jgi:leucyl-tRNA synthetase
MVDIHKIEKKWAKKWVEEKIFQPSVDTKKKKFFVNAPYPYVNSVLHIGHLYTYMRTEVFARYKRMQGFNVLFPQAWHATGSPIVSAANRVKEKEPKQIAILKQAGVFVKDITKFEKPEYWIDYFIPEAVKDFQAMGMSIDWSRQFHTTSLNPHYDKFIQWQFRKLKEKGKVIKGKFPVVWCPKDNNAVGDHSRSEGEGETPQEFVLVKHTLDDGKHVVSATLRQDTIYGITNLYVHPDAEYAEVKVTTPTGKNETWILSEHSAHKLEEQGWNIKIIGSVKGTDLIGQKTTEFGDRKVLILPATFLDPTFGTGLVHSVPSDSADDLIALWDLQKDDATIKKYRLNAEEVKAITPIAVLDTPGYGRIAAEKMLKDNDVTSQNDRKKLDKIKKELYKLSYYEATFNELYKKGFSKNLYGKKVEDGKDLIKENLLKEGWIEIYYQLTGKVVCRCLTECTVKIVEDQWFMAYGDEKWKKEVHTAFNNLTLYPEKSRAQFEYVIDWLHNWACTRETGLGTRLPWDEKWLIESLSDSTIYMAYYTIVQILREIKPELIDDNLFDYIMLNKDVKVKVDKKLANEMREEFNYWYPVDFRNSGKDLIQNHLTFFIFNHTAIFPKKHWPKGIGVNGWVTVDGEKMSKSKGNMIPLREMPTKFSVDCARFTILSGGEDMDDPNWDSAFATALKSKLGQFYEFCVEHYGKGRSNRLKIDDWMESKLNEVIAKTTQSMEETMFRSALQAVYFELNNAVKWYTRRCGEFNKDVMKKVIDAQIRLLCPVVPFICEEIWEKIGGKGYLSLANWPTSSTKKIDSSLDAGEELVRHVVNDIITLKKLTKIEKLSKVTLFVSLPWKYKLYSELAKLITKTRNPGEVLKSVMSKAEFKPHGKEISKFVPKLVGSGKVPTSVSSEKVEFAYLGEAKSFLEEEFGCIVEVMKASSSDNPKGKSASPGKVGILVE